MAGDTALVVADAVRAHNDHEVEAVRFTPMLAKGTSMLILEGPKHGSGYHWYRVALINATLTGVSGDGPDDIRGLPVWVPVASRDGEAWLRHGKARCPATPSTVLELYALPMGARVTCFSQETITVRAEIVTNEAGCDYDPGMSIRPRWFSGEHVTLADGSRSLVLATPAGAAPDPFCPPFDTLLYVDPAGTHPDPLPLGRRVTVTGRFDHPAAARCRWKWGEDSWRATDACRYWFVATEITRTR